MKKTLLVAAFAACLSVLTLPANSGFAQVGARPAAAAPTPQRATVVVLDVGAVFKQHIRFNQQMEVMKQDVANFETTVREEGARINKLRESLKDYNPGSPNARDLEKQIAELTSKLQVDMQIKKRDFMEREAKLYFNVYNEVKAAVAWFANSYGISLVLRYNSEKIDPADRQSVLAGVNSPIVFQRELDITGHIVAKVNEGTPTADVRNNTRPLIPRQGPVQPR